jgi:hypothetical protein
MPITRSPSPLMSQSQRAYAERSSPNLKTLPSIFQTNPPALDLAVKSSEDDWVLETSRVSRASTKSLSEEIKSRAQQWQAKDIDHAASPEGHINLPKDQSSLSDSRTSSIELPLRSRRRSRICESFDSTSSADRSEYEYIARQAEAYNTVLGHLYPEGKSVASLPDSTRHLHQSQRLFQFQSYGSRRSSSVSPERNHPQWNYPVHRADVSSARNDISHYQPRGGQMPNMQAHPEKDQFQDFDRGSQTPQRGVSASPYRSTPDRTIHVSRYPSRKRASSDGKNPTYNDWESQYEQDYFSPQQDARPLSPEPPLIPLESRRKSMPIYVQEHPSRRVSIQRYHTMDGYVQPNQVSEQTSSIYTSNRISFTTHESYDSYTRASYIHDNRRSTAIDERIAIAHIDSSYRQSKINLTLDYAESQEVQEPSQDDQRHSHLGTSRFPQPPSNDSSRKLRQLLGSEYREGGPRSPPAPFSECLMLQMQSQSPIVTKLDQSPSPAALSRASSVASSGKKVLDMPRSSDRKKKSFLGLLRKKKSSGTLLAVN